jgi:hypothetical protein
MLIFATSRKSRKGRNLARNPRIAAHLESGDDVVILEGEVEEISDRALLTGADAAYAAKYVNPESGEGFRLYDETSTGNVVYGLRPRVVFAWRERDFPTSATRWRSER